jgi:alpha-N-arabinofuranosidase
LRWEDGWPHFLDPGEVLPPLVARPQLPQFSGTDWRHWRDDFADVRLSPEWISLRTPGVVQQLGLDRAAGELWIIPGRDSAHSPRNPAFTGRRLRHHAAEVTTRVAFAPREQGDFAGLLAYMDEAHFLAFGIEGSGSGPTLVARLKDSPADEATGAVIARVPLAAIDAIDLRLRIDGGSAHLAWRPHGADDWIRLVSDADIEGLASVHAGLFTGLVIGPYAAAGD